MSRLARKGVFMPQGVSARFDGDCVYVENGSKQLSMVIPKSIAVANESGRLYCRFAEGVRDHKDVRALLGTTHAQLNNLVLGVTEGFSVELNLVGIGYGVTLEENTLVFSLGKSHPDHFVIPSGVTVSIPEKNVIKITGMVKADVTSTADALVKLRRPNAYSGKGVRYSKKAYTLKEVKK